MRLKTGNWRVERPLLDIDELFSEEFGRLEYESDSKIIREKERFWGLYTHRSIVEKREDSFELDTVIEGHLALKFIYIFGLFQLYNTVMNGSGALSTIFSTVFLITVFYYLYAPTFDYKLYEIASLNKRRVNPFLFLFLFAALVLLWYRLRTMHPSYPVDLVSAALFCYFLICSYSLNLIPWVSDSANNSVLFTPAFAVQRIVFSISLFASFGFFVGFYWFQAQTALDTLSELEPSAGNASVAADGTGGMSPAELQIAVLETVGVPFAFAFVIITLYMILETVQSRRVVRLQQVSVRQPFESKMQRNTLLAGFAVTTVLIVVLLIPIASIILYGAFGGLALPGAELYTGEYTAQPVGVEVSSFSLEQNQSSLNTSSMNASELRDAPLVQNVETETVVGEKQTASTEELVAANHDALRHTLWFMPGPEYLKSGLVLGMLMFPAMMLVLTWLLSIPKYFIRNISLIIRSERLECEGLDTDSIQIRKVEGDLDFLVKPASVFFGFRRYVLVNEKVDDSLEQNELNAVLEHEIYHIKNRDLQVGKISLLLSFCYGGENALLAFYDYPQIEREADDYAAEKHGERALTVALDKMYKIGREFDISSYDAVGDSGSDNDDDEDSSSSDSDDDGGGESLEDTMDAYLVAPKELLYGDLVVSAHPSRGERLNRIQGEDRP